MNARRHHQSVRTGLGYILDAFDADTASRGRENANQIAKENSRTYNIEM